MISFPFFFSKIMPRSVRLFPEKKTERGNFAEKVRGRAEAAQSFSETLVKRLFL